MYSSMSRHRHQTAAEEVMAPDWMVRDNIPQQKPKQQPQQQSSAAWLPRIGKYLMHHLLNGHEPRVWQKRNAAGEIVYHAHDPYTGRSNDFTSETDLRIWLEQLPNLHKRS